MSFQLIDLEHWPRLEYYQHYTAHVPCTYSMTAELDVTALRTAAVRFYPAMLWLLTRQVNRWEEFRTALDDQGRPGVFDQMHPCYTVFHQDTQLFSEIWTEFDPSFPVFLQRYEEDLRCYGDVPGMLAKPNPPENTFPVSMIPWTSFQGFHLSLEKGFDYLLPIFTMGKFFSRGDQWFLPLAIQVHHGVCDGFHISRFFNSLQEDVRRFST